MAEPGFIEAGRGQAVTLVTVIFERGHGGLQFPAIFSSYAVSFPKTILCSYLQLPYQSMALKSKSQPQSAFHISV